MGELAFARLSVASLDLGDRRALESRCGVYFGEFYSALGYFVSGDR